MISSKILYFALKSLLMLDFDFSCVGDRRWVLYRFVEEVDRLEM